MKKMYLLLIIVGILAFQPVTYADDNVDNKSMIFSDVIADAWYYKDVCSAINNGLVNGKTETTFCPDELLTYAEALKLAACMNQLYTQGEITLTAGNPWYMPYFDYCVEHNIFKSDGNINLNEFVTREAYISIFANALPDNAYEIINDIAENAIPDVPASAKSSASVYKLYRAGIITGADEAHNCNPDANITRAEVAVILTRMMDPAARIVFDINNETHKHDFNIFKDEKYHWEECSTCYEKRNLSEHKYLGGACYICGIREAAKDEDISLL